MLLRSWTELRAASVSQMYGIHEDLLPPCCCYHSTLIKPALDFWPHLIEQLIKLSSPHWFNFFYYSVLHCCGVAKTRRRPDCSASFRLWAVVHSLGFAKMFSTVSSCVSACIRSFSTFIHWSAPAAVACSLWGLLATAPQGPKRACVSPCIPGSCLRLCSVSKRRPYRHSINGFVAQRSSLFRSF